MFDFSFQRGEGDTRSFPCLSHCKLFVWYEIYCFCHSCLFREISRPFFKFVFHNFQCGLVDWHFYVCFQIYSLLVIMHSLVYQRQLPFSSIFKKYHTKDLSELALSPDLTWIADLTMTNGTSVLQLCTRYSLTPRTVYNFVS